MSRRIKWLPTCVSAWALPHANLGVTLFSRAQLPRVPTAQSPSRSVSPLNVVIKAPNPVKGVSGITQSKSHLAFCRLQRKPNPYAHRVTASPIEIHDNKVVVR